MVINLVNSSSETDSNCGSCSSENETRADENLSLGQSLKKSIKLTSKYKSKKQKVMKSVLKRVKTFNNRSLTKKEAVDRISNWYKMMKRKQETKTMRLNL